jgi:predicted dehydrogenase
MADPAGWGILGTGKIARIFAKDVQDAGRTSVVAVGSRNLERATAFAREFGAASAYGSYEALTHDPRVHFVYVATPHTTHVQLAMEAASAGKHVLCEKPIAVDAVGAARMVAHARECGTFLMEAFAFRCHPQTHRLIQLLEAGEIGEVRSMSATFGYDAGPAPTNYLLRRDLAGGSILDVGCYTVALTRQLAGVPVGQPFRDATRFVGAGLLHPGHGVDLDANAVAWFEGGFTGQLACSVRTNLDSSVLITGTEGWIRLPTPWLPGRLGGPARIEIHRHRGPAREIAIGDHRGLYAIEADTVVERAHEGRLEAPEMSWADSLGNMAALDCWRAELGVRYDTDPDPATLSAADRAIGGASG